MSERTITSASAPRTYAELRRSVEDVIFAGRARIEEAWLRTYHDTGHLIHEHLLLHQDRADFGAKLFIRLADDTGISKRVLYECVQLYRCFPIVRTSAQLTRSHYLLLCKVPDPEMITAEGKAAKRCADPLLPVGGKVIVTTTKPDKYDRYLADVFVSGEDGEVFLNNHLLQQGHATRKDAWEFGDWGV